MEQRLAAMQQHVSALEEDKVRAQQVWWNEKEALMQAWSGDHNRLMALMSGDAGVPSDAAFLAPPPEIAPVPVGTEAMRVAGDRLMQELAMMRHERSMAAVPERRAAEYRVRALEVQLARENHARGYASLANADRGIYAFSREVSAGAQSVPLGDKLNEQLKS